MTFIVRITYTRKYVCPSTDFHEALALNLLISNSQTDFREIQTKSLVADARIHNGKQAEPFLYFWDDT